jgi:hypothetical protein
MEIDLHPKRYKHYHLKSVPEKQQNGEPTGIPPYNRVILT